ncbi:hypothetical protein HY095_02425 [Candidatus Micrarchaeota archaeon]|nr:hypothetical protein [Candidatus Micrarchaeota archaeon]
MDVQKAQLQHSSVFGDHGHAFMRDQTRLSYLEHFIPHWRGQFQFRTYAIGLAIAGVVMLFRFPPLAVPALALAAYFYQKSLLSTHHLHLDRKLVGADL